MDWALSHHTPLFVRLCCDFLNEQINTWAAICAITSGQGDCHRGPLEVLMPMFVSEIVMTMLVVMTFAKTCWLHPLKCRFLKELLKLKIRNGRKINVTNIYTNAVKRERERPGARGRGVWWQYDCMSLCPKFQLQVQKLSITDTKEKGRNVRKPGVKCPPPASWRIQAAVLEWERCVAPRKSAAAWAVSSCHFLHVDKDGLCVFTQLFPRFPPFPCFPVLSMGNKLWHLEFKLYSNEMQRESCMKVKTIQRWQLSCRFELVSSLDLSKSDFDTSWPLTNTSPQLSKASSRRADNMASTLKSLTVNDRRRNGRKLDASWWCGILTQMLLVDAVTWSRPLSESKNASGVRKGKSWNKIVVVAQSLETKTRLGSAANGILNIKHMMIKYAKYILIYIYITPEHSWIIYIISLSMLWLCTFRSHENI